MLDRFVQQTAAKQGLNPKDEGEFNNPVVTKCNKQILVLEDNFIKRKNVKCQVPNRKQ